MKKGLNNFHDKTYFMDVARIKYAIAMLMRNHNLIQEIKIDNRPEKILSSYGRIAKTGAFGIEFSRGVPRFICTPYGAVPIESAEKCYGYLDDYRRFIFDLDTIFGLVENDPIKKSIFEEIGPRCTITHLPWKDKEKFPRFLEDEEILNNEFMVGSQEEQKHVAEIYADVNDEFIQMGHPEFVRKGLSQATQVVEPKKKTCIIMGQLKQLLKRKDTDKTL